MEPDPASSRSLLPTLALVLVAAVGGYLVFTSRGGGGGGGDREAEPLGAELDAVRSREMPPPAGMDAARVAKLRALVDGAISGEDGDARRVAGLGLLEEGASAVPFLLDALHIALTTPGSSTTAPIAQSVSRADAVLRRIRIALTPESPPDPVPKLPGSTWFVRRAKSWFVWWDAYVEKHPAAR